MDTCDRCHGHLEAQRVSRMQEYNGRWYLIENLPALICQDCGETYFTPEAHDHVITLITREQPPSRVETVNVLDAS